MARLAKFAAAGLAAPAFALAVAACQPPMTTAPALDTAAPANAMTVAEVEALVVGKTIIIRDENRKVSRAEYFAPDGTVKLKAKPDSMSMSFSFSGTHYFDDEGKLCTNYPTLPVNPKEFCEYVVSLGDGRHALAGGGVYERILDGEQLGELK